MLCDVAGAEDQVLNDRPNPTALDIPLPGRAVFQGFLTDHAQEVIGQDHQLQHQTIGGKLARGQTFHVHVGLDLAVVLFTLAMRMVAGYDIIIRPAEVGPPGVYLDVRQCQTLSMFVYGALDDLIADPQTDGFLLSVGCSIGHILPRGTDIHGLAFPRMADVLTAGFHLVEPCVPGFLPQIALDG